MDKQIPLFRPITNDTPLAVERSDLNMGGSLHAGGHREYTHMGFTVSHAYLDDGCSYHTLITDKIWLCGKEERSRARLVLKSILLAYLKRVGFCLRSGKVLFCGLGNPNLTADAVGPMIADRLAVGGRDRFLRSVGFAELYAVKPGVPAQSGMGTGEHIDLLAKHLSADLIITADATAAKTVKRLASVIQVTDKGVWAGSGREAPAGKHGTADEITKDTMPCPVLSIGVPTVIRTSVLCDNCEREDTEEFLVSHSHLDLITQCYADIISGALNSIFSAPFTE